ncbi:unnamed protein product [Parascedosporium putredinis]|uniref:Hyaluronan/mRNA-binding protein domain-containing protein n=1 Tax=Parascedosporium putredinis TaxID=1442378 RepID=A0A9P1M5W9_9PEZI|nr:unnamed protein product [Parascedosporium putredinis]CAI7988588.1 unnamed protein product [Parascedosporium putredinis]
MSVVTKNPFDLLGEDGEAPVVKGGAAQSARGAKTDAAARGGNTQQRRGYSGSEAAFRDRGAGVDRNRTRTTDDGARGSSRGGGYGARVRGGRGSRHPRERDDRHSKNIAPGSEKQAAQSWGAAEGEAELKDEVAGEEIAKKEAREGDAEAKEVEAEPEDKHISYEDYLAQLAQKKLALEGPAQVRQANEGSKLDKKWASAKPLVKEEDDDFISAASGGKAKRERERKVKQVVDIDQRYVEPERTRGGRGGPRGGAPAALAVVRVVVAVAVAMALAAAETLPVATVATVATDVTINTSDQSAFPSLGK